MRYLAFAFVVDRKPKGFPLPTTHLKEFKPKEEAKI